MTEKSSVNNANLCKLTSAPLFGFRPEKISDVQNKSFMETTQRKLLSVLLFQMFLLNLHLLCVMSLSTWDLVGGGIPH